MFKYNKQSTDTDSNGIRRGVLDLIIYFIDYTICVNGSN